MKKIAAYILGYLSLLALLGGGIGMSAEAQGRTSDVKSDEYFASKDALTIVYGEQDSRATNGATVRLSDLTGKTEASFEYRNYIKKEELTDGFLTLSFETPNVYGETDFDYLFVELSDAINPEEKLVWAVAPQPTTCGWWNYWTSAWISGISDLTATTRAAWTYPALLQVSGTEQTVYGRNSSFVNQYNVLYDGGSYYDAGFNLGAKKDYFVRETESSVMNWLNFGLSGTQATLNNNLIADITNTEWLQDSGAKLIGTQYENVYTEERMANLFSSGYCTLKIRYYGLHSDSVDCHIKKIGGQTLAQQAESKVKNDTPFIDVRQTTHAVFGKAYILPEAYIVDMREGDISSRAVYSFFDETGKEIPYTGNSVDFPCEGTYTMRCSISLRGGETFFTDRSVRCYATTPRTNFITDIDLKTEYKTGDRVVIASATATNPLSPLEDGSVTPLVVLQRNGSEMARYDASHVNYYTIEKEGDYVLAYIYSNEYGETDVLTYAFRAEKSIYAVPSFIPVSFTSAKENVVADCSVTDYIQGRSVSEIYRAAYIDDELIYLAKGEQVLSGSLTFKKTFSTNSAILTYKVGYSQNALNDAVSYVVPVIQTKYAEDYVIISDAQGNYNRENVKSIVSDSAVVFEITEDKTFTLPQRLHADDLELLFDVMSESSFEALDIVFQDYIDDTKKIVFTARKTTNGTALYINGKDAGTLGLSFDSDADYFHIVYECDEVNNRLVDSRGNALSAKIAKIATWSNGASFDGYTDGTVKVSFTVKGVSGQARFALKRVNNQGFYTETIGENKQPFSDYSAPVLYINGTYETRYSLSDTIIVHSAEAYDVLSINANTTLTVERPNGSIYYQGDAEKAFSLLLNEYGNWIITYSTNDGNEWFVSEERFVFNVVDSIPPIITVQGSLPTYLALNTEYTFPSAVVFDNVTQNCKYYVIVSRPDGMREAVSGNKYTFTRKGMYTVSYYVTDEYMNVTQKTFDIWVE